MDSGITELDKKPPILCWMFSHAWTGRDGLEVADLRLKGLDYSVKSLPGCGDISRAPRRSPKSRR